MFEKLSYTWTLMGESWRVLKRDKTLVFFPLLSGLSCALVIASFLIPMISSDAFTQQQQQLRSADPAKQVAYYALLFAFYFCNYFVITFFNTAIIACAMSRMAGGDPTFRGGLNEAFKRIHLIAGWALVSATVGLILRIIEERSPKVGRFIAGLLGMAWTMLTYLVVPVMVMQNKGPFASLKESASLLRKTWGEQLAGNFSFGLVFFFLGIPAYALMFIGFRYSNGNQALMMTAIGVGVVYLVGLALIQSALQSIFQAAIYMHTQGISGGPEGFPVKLLKPAMTTRD